MNIISFASFKKPIRYYFNFLKLQQLRKCTKPIWVLQDSSKKLRIYSSSYLQAEKAPRIWFFFCMLKNCMDEIICGCFSIIDIKYSFCLLQTKLKKNAFIFLLQATTTQKSYKTHMGCACFQKLKYIHLVIFKLKKLKG